jgi:uncharacterized repeat protein (TIGR01451 family)
MKGWQRSARWAVLAQFIGLLFALAVSINRGQGQFGPNPMCIAPQATVPSSDEPPLAGTPPPQTPGPTAPPFTAPEPTPLPPGDAPPFPGVPFVGAEPMDPPAPLVRLRVRAPARVQPDKEIEYRLIVENVSQAPAHHVLVRDRLPPGTKFARAKPEPTKQTQTKASETDVLWEFGTLKPGEQKTIVLTIDPAGAGEVKNSAYVQFEHGQTVTTRIAKAGLQVRVTAPAQSVLPEAIPFRLDLTNTGQAPAKDVVLKDELPDGLVFGNSKPPTSSENPLVWKLGTLSPGETRRVEYQAIPTRAGTFRNKAEATAAGGLSQKASAEVTVGEAKLALIKTGPQRRLINRPAPYQITVSNPGTMAATGVEVSDELPAGIEFLSASAGGRVEGGYVRWSLGTLPPGARRSLQVVLRAPRPGRFGNMARARAERDLSAKALTETVFESASGPTVEIDPSAGPLDVGQKATYTIRIINAGKENYLRPIVIVTVPEAMTVLGQRGPTTAEKTGQTIRFDPLPALDAGKETVYTVEAEARKAGEANLRVELTDGRSALGAPKVWEEKTIVREAPPAVQIRQTHRH